MKPYQFLLLLLLNLVVSGCGQYGSLYLPPPVAEPPKTLPARVEPEPEPKPKPDLKPESEPEIYR